MIHAHLSKGLRAGPWGTGSFSLDFEIQEREFSTRKMVFQPDQNLHRQVVLGGDGEETLITTNVRGGERQAGIQLDLDAFCFLALPIPTVSRGSM